MLSFRHCFNTEDTKRFLSTQRGSLRRPLTDQSPERGRPKVGRASPQYRDTRHGGGAHPSVSQPVATRPAPLLSSQPPGAVPRGRGEASSAPPRPGGRPGPAEPPGAPHAASGGRRGKWREGSPQGLRQVLPRLTSPEAVSSWGEASTRRVGCYEAAVAWAGGVIGLFLLVRCKTDPNLCRNVISAPVNKSPLYLQHS